MRALTLIVLGVLAGALLYPRRDRSTPVMRARRRGGW